MKIAFAIFVLIHGLIHILGFAKAFHLAEVSQLTQPISRAADLLWPIAAIRFAVSAAFLFFTIDFWRGVGLMGILHHRG
jgi:hypothetical protein